MNAIADPSKHSVPAATSSELRALARIRFCMRVLQQRCSQYPADYVWPIKYKVACHLQGVMMRRAPGLDTDDLPELSPAEKQALLDAHPLLQADAHLWSTRDQNAAWMQDLKCRIARFADSARRRREDSGCEHSV